MVSRPFARRSGPPNPRCLAAALLLALSPLPSHAAQGGACGTTVPGGAVGPGTTWKLAGSPYCVTGHLTVAGLTIEPGVRVSVDPGARITVTGVLVAAGTPAAPIAFTSSLAAPPSNRHWLGLVFAAGAPPGSVLEHCIVERASATGLVLQAPSHPPAIRNCTFRDNFAIPPSIGGGVAIVGTTARTVLADCRITGNLNAYFAGGVFIETAGGGSVELVRCTIEDNVAGVGIGAPAFLGGGALIDGTARLVACRIARNEVRGAGSFQISAIVAGGGLWVDGDVELENCAIVLNRCVGLTTLPYQRCFGGGLYAREGPGTALRLRNTLVACNACVDGVINPGSGLYVGANATATLENCTVARGNTEGIASEAGSTLTIANSIVYENGTSGQGLAGAPASVRYSDVESVDGVPHTGPGNIALPPRFRSAAGCEVCDLALLPSSPCIDAGDPAPSFDDRCHPPSLGTARNDMGVHGGPRACLWGVGATSVYCTAKVNSLACTPAIHADGVPSATAAAGFTVVARNVRNAKPGTLLYTVCGSRAALPFQGGTLCLDPAGLRRTPAQVSAGSPPPASDCSGTWQIDMNAYAQSAPSPSGPAPFLRLPGAVVHCQWWGRDPGFAPPNDSTLTDAVEYHVGL